MEPIERDQRIALAVRNCGSLAWTVTVDDIGGYVIHCRECRFSDSNTHWDTSIYSQPQPELVTYATWAHHLRSTHPGRHALVLDMDNLPSDDEMRLIRRAEWKARNKRRAKAKQQKLRERRTELEHGADLGLPPAAT